MSSLLIDRKIVLNEAGDYTEEYLDGRLHLVVNGVAIAEGVWSGSEGPVYYPPDELRASDPSWDHKPIVLNHPKDKNGVPVSAASVSVLNATKVGLQMNTVTGDDGKQRFKAYIDVDKANSVDARLVQNIRSKTKVEVSTGLVAELVKKKGVWNGQGYDYTAKNFKPDHLAVLLDEPGAYSVASGGGLLANSGGQVLSDEVKKFLAPGVANWLTRTGLLVNGSLEEVKYKLARLLAATYGETGKEFCGYVEATFDDKVVFSKDYRSGYFLVGYKAVADGVELVGEAVQVHSVYGYRTPDGSVMLTNSSGELKPIPQEYEDMSKHKGHIDALVTNGQYLEQQRPWLESLGDGVTNIPLVPKAVVPVLNAATGVPAPPSTPKVDVTGFLAQLAQSNPDMAFVLNQGVAQVETRRTLLVNAIKAAPGNKFSEEWLKTQRIEFLEGVAALIPQSASEQTTVHNGYQSGPPMFVLQNGMHSTAGRVAEEPLVVANVEDAPAKK